MNKLLYTSTLILLIIAINFNNDCNANPTKLLNKRSLVFKEFAKLTQDREVEDQTEGGNTYGGDSDKGGDYEAVTYGSRTHGGGSYGGDSPAESSQKTVVYKSGSYGSGGHGGGSYGGGNGIVGGLGYLKGCYSISKTATNFWCHVNCYNVKSYCPHNFCKCF